MIYENLHCQQEYEFDCGDGIVAPLLRLCNIDFKYDELMKVLKTTEQEGTISTNMISFLNQNGFKVVFFQNSNLATLKWQVDSGKICVPMFQNWDIGESDPGLNFGHYAFIDKFSIDEISKGNLVTTIDPAINEGLGLNRGKWQYSAEEFNRVWIDKERDKVIMRGFMAIDR